VDMPAILKTSMPTFSLLERLRNNPIPRVYVNPVTMSGWKTPRQASFA
jgi:hypothetical protein